MVSEETGSPPLEVEQEADWWQSYHVMHFASVCCLERSVIFNKCQYLLNICRRGRIIFLSVHQCAISERLSRIRASRQQFKLTHVYFYVPWPIMVLTDFLFLVAVSNVCTLAISSYLFSVSHIHKLFRHYIAISYCSFWFQYVLYAEWLKIIKQYILKHK